MGGFVRLERAKRIVRLHGEVRDLGAGTHAARQHVLEVMVREIGAVAAGISVDTAQGRPGGFRDGQMVGFEGSMLRVFDALLAGGASVNPAYDAYVRRYLDTGETRVLTLTNEELVARATWEASPWVNESLRNEHLDHCLVTGVSRGGGVLEGMALFRATGDRPFSEEDRNVLHLLEDAWRIACPTEPSVALPPRASDTLRELLTGASNKEIAARLGISPTTVHQYTKTIYRAHGVHGRAELLAKVGRFSGQ